VGAAVVFASLIYSAVSLQDTIRQKQDLEGQILDLGSRVSITQKLLDDKTAALAGTTAEISRLQTAQSGLQAKVADMEQTITDKDTELNRLRERISHQKCALIESGIAIVAFHQREYEDAIEHYSRALACDPENAYLRDLKAYSLFRAGRLDEALADERQGVAADPSYAPTGYFEIARFLCASKKFPEAKDAISKALQLQPEFKETMRRDGEFMRLCKGLLP
jgi:tetratricopeptide (TPR) repeat protein